MLKGFSRTSEYPHNLKKKGRVWRDSIFHLKLFNEPKKVGYDWGLKRIIFLVHVVILFWTITHRVVIYNKKPCHITPAMWNTVDNRIFRKAFNWKLIEFYSVITDNNLKCTEIFLRSYMQFHIHYTKLLLFISLHLK